MKSGYSKIKKGIWAIAAVILFCLPGLRLPYLDQNADVYVTKAISKAGAAYTICRGINAGVSVIKESQLHLSLGAGISVAAGQILDPLDDLTERTSDILITSIVSLGIQKIVYELCLWVTPLLLAVAIVILIVISFFHWKWNQKLQRIILKVIFLISIARLCLPITALISSGLDHYYFSPKINHVQEELNQFSSPLERFKELPPEYDGIWNTLKNGTDFIKEKIVDLWAIFQAINPQIMIENLLKLSYIYIALFIIQVILLPLGIFWLLTRIVNAFRGTNVPYILKFHQNRSIKQCHETASKNEN